MRPRQVMRLGCLLLGLAPTFVFGQSTTVHHFAGHTFQLSLPDGYELAAEASPEARGKVFAFGGPPRPDRTRSTIGVSLLDLRRENLSLEGLTEKARAGFRQVTKAWDSRETDARLAGVPVKRLEWTGEATLSRPGLPQKAAALRGVSYVGIKDGIGFTVSARDTEAFAATTIPLCERAIASFALEPEGPRSR
jgi:hypothetical protein